MNSRDERIDRENNKVYAQMYPVILGLTAVVTAWMLFDDRSVGIYVPAMIAVGGSLLFLLVRYAQAGLLFSRKKDEYITDYKYLTKALCHHFCVFVYMIGGVVGIFVFDDNSVASRIFFVWVIPTWIGMILTTRRGVGSFTESMGLDAENKRKMRRTYLITLPIGALIFGAFTAWMDSCPYERVFGELALWTLINGTVFGVFFTIFIYVYERLNKRFANKVLKKAEESVEDPVAERMDEPE